jgi:hypothetical protein
MAANENQIQDVLENLLLEMSSGDRDHHDEIDPDEVLVDSDVRTFESAMVMTQDAGLVLRLADGSEFQITIVRSK